MGSPAFCSNSLVTGVFFRWTARESIAMEFKRTLPSSLFPTSFCFGLRELGFEKKVKAPGHPASLAN